MYRSRALSLSAAVLAIAVLLTAPARLPAQQAAPVAIDNDDIGGVVRSPRGPEAGVWVIAETTDLSTKLAKIAVTDDQGRYVVPDLPTNSTYQVFVRGYGLVDSPRQRAKPGQQLNLTAQTISGQISLLARLRPSRKRKRVVARKITGTKPDQNGYE